MDENAHYPGEDNPNLALDQCEYFTFQMRRILERIPQDRSAMRKKHIHAATMIPVRTDRMTYLERAMFDRSDELMPWREVLDKHPVPTRRPAGFPTGGADPREFTCADDYLFNWTLREQKLEQELFFAGRSEPLPGQSSWDGKAKELSASPGTGKTAEKYCCPWSEPIGPDAVASEGATRKLEVVGQHIEPKVPLGRLLNAYHRAEEREHFERSREAMMRDHRALHARRKSRSFPISVDITIKKKESPLRFTSSENVANLLELSQAGPRAKRVSATPWSKNLINLEGIRDNIPASTDSDVQLMSVLNKQMGTTCAPRLPHLGRLREPLATTVREMERKAENLGFLARGVFALRLVRKLRKEALDSKEADMSKSSETVDAKWSVDPALQETFEEWQRIEEAKEEQARRARTKSGAGDDEEEPLAVDKSMQTDGPPPRPWRTRPRRFSFPTRW